MLATGPAPATAPLHIFADQPSSIQVGPYVTKFTLGVIDGDGEEFPRPVVTVAMPTINLIRMVSDLQEIFSDPEFRNDSAKVLAADSKKYLSSLGTAKTALSQRVSKRIVKT